MFPVSSSGLRFSLGDVPTDIHLSRYADRLLCIVTQTGTCGSIFQAKFVRSVRTKQHEIDAMQDDGTRRWEHRCGDRASVWPT